MEIIESLCSSKTGRQDDCEDKLVVSDAFIAVIDGATSSTSKTFRSLTGGKMAAELIANCLTSGIVAPEMDAETAMSRIQAELQNYENTYSLEAQGVHLCASAVIYSSRRQQVWAVGDCQFLLNGKHYTYAKKVDAVLAETRSLAIHMLLQKGYTEESLLKHDLGREMIVEHLRLQQQLENTDDEYGYAVFSSRGQVKSIAVTDVPSGSEVVLASDGYPELYATLAESEARLNELLLADPLCYKVNKGTKGVRQGCTHYDDRTYIRFRIG